MAERLKIGGSISHYRIVSKIGEGGMGEVYLAHDTKLERQVALKILSADVAKDKDLVRRFEQEAKAASALNHPNILTVHEIGDFEDSRYIATELIKGQTLRNLLHNEPLTLREALDVAMQVAAALNAAHEAGIVHRDIKPENIMIRDDGLVKVLDFGLAKLAPHQPKNVASEETTLAHINTKPGVIMGTVVYMSPEQARGKPTDARSDIWSLGAVMHEMLTGEILFGGETSSDSIVAILTKEPPPLEETTPSELQRIVRKSLQKKADERYQTVKDLLLDVKNLKHELEFSEELERSHIPRSTGSSNVVTGQVAENATAMHSGTLSTQNSMLQHLSSAEYLVSGIKSHKLIAAPALLILILGAGFLGYRSFLSGSKQIESIAVMPFVNPGADADTEYLADGITESLINSLSQLPKLRMIARSSVFRYKGKEVNPQAVGRELGVQAILTGRVVQHGDNLSISVELVDVQNNSHLWGAQYNRKLSDLLTMQSEISLDISQKLRSRLAGEDQKRVTKHYTENTEAYQAYLKGRYYWNKGLGPGFEKSREYFQQAIDRDPTYALAYSGLADYYGFASANGLLPPDENWPKVEAAANKALALDGTLAESYNPLAAVKLYYYRDWPAAERYFRRGIELNPNFAEIHTHYALCLVLFGRGDEALAEVQRAIEFEPLSLRFSYFRGRLLFSMRQYDRAIDQLGKALELDPNFPVAHESLGDAYEQKGMYREAVTEWGKALTLSGAGDQGSILERTYASSGFEAAVRALAQQQLEKLNERMKRGEYVPASEYVTVYTRLGDKEQAFAWLDKAVQERNAFVFAVRVDPIYDKLRDDPRYADLVHRMGLRP